MPYAADNRISSDPIDGGIEINDAQYAEGLAGLIAGKIVSIDGGFAVKSPPEPGSPSEPLPLPRSSQILNRLSEIDWLSIRPSRAVHAGMATQADHDKLTALENEAIDLRAELDGLPAEQ